jgi:hypothetical protein
MKIMAGGGGMAQYRRRAGVKALAYALGIAISAKAIMA